MPRRFSFGYWCLLWTAGTLLAFLIPAGPDAVLSYAAGRTSFVVKPAKDEINVRSDASIQSEQVVTVRRNEQVTVTDEKYDWYKIILPARVNGYVYAAYIQTSGPQQGTVIASSVNIRLKPDLQGLIIGTVKRGERLTVRGKEGDWSVVQAYPYAHGWVHKSLVLPLIGQEAAVSQPESAAKEVFDASSSPALPAVTVSSLRLFQKTQEVDGVVKKNEGKSFCDAPYLLKTERGTLFLKAPVLLESHLSKKVRVAGSYVLGDRCVYLDAASLKIAR